MFFEPTFDLVRAQTQLHELISFVGEATWRQRVEQLIQLARRSSAQEKIVRDYHWLEIVLGLLAFDRPYIEQTKCTGLNELAALQFGTALVEVNRRLSAKGQKALRGRLLDSLKAENGLAPLHLELEMGMLLLGEGFEIEWPDLEQFGRVDLRFKRDTVVGEIECKSLSVDAGRRIHRKDFYRFVDSVGFDPDTIGDRQRIVVLTVKDRFPADIRVQAELREAIISLLKDGSAVHSQNFHAVVERLEFVFAGEPSETTERFNEHCRNRYGASVHVYGAWTERGACYVAIRSEQEDDTSLPLLNAMKKAATQLSEGSGLIAVQFNDLPPALLAAPHFRRRTALLANAMFHSRAAEQIAAVYYCAYAGLQRHHGRLGTPGTLCPNPEFTGSRAGLPLHHGVSGVEFAEILKIDPKTIDLDYYQYGLGL